jgi:putative ABC transport system ATP-binding protein
MAELLVLDGVGKGFDRGGRRLRVLVGVSLVVGAGEIVSVVGSRDEGKTTLLRVAGGMLRADGGVVRLGGRDLSGLGDGELSRLLGWEVGWVGRGGPGGLRLEVRDYVGLPLVTGRWLGRRRPRALAVEALERLGVGGCARQQWEELSNWQRVLVELAQGIVGRPQVLLVDDVIDGLGMAKTMEAMRVLRSLVAEFGFGVLMACSDHEAALSSDRVWSLDGGELTLMADATASDPTVIPFPERRGAESSTAPADVGVA